jgi:hypothetical protein
MFSHEAVIYFGDGPTFRRRSRAEVLLIIAVVVCREAQLA